MRSGEFISGPFDLYAAVWHQGYGKMWFTPVTLPPGTTQSTELNFTLEAVRLDSAGPADGFTKSTLARGLPNGPLFFATGFRLPSPGYWLLTAQAGNNWGCFLFFLL
ncbi:MAG TPA: hypothetical protein VGA78_05485 [Gemmatimonadales bacterium]